MITEAENFWLKVTELIKQLLEPKSTFFFFFFASVCLCNDQVWFLYYKDKLKAQKSICRSFWINGAQALLCLGSLHPAESSLQSLLHFPVPQAVDQWVQHRDDHSVKYWHNLVLPERFPHVTFQVYEYERPEEKNHCGYVRSTGGEGLGFATSWRNLQNGPNDEQVGLENHWNAGCNDQES